ncbi:MAG: peptidoglycan DD-metalloendopeptidase family protein, partial [Alphaproteobacteria bacterium]
SMTLAHRCSREGIIRRRLEGLIADLYPQRQLLVRAKGRVLCVNLSWRLQAAATVAVVCAFAWLMFASAGVLVYGSALSERDEDLDRSRSAYASLLRVFSGYQESLTTVSDQVETGRLHVLSFVNQIWALRTDLNETELKLQAIEAERARVTSINDSLTRQTKQLEARLKAAESQNALLRKETASLDSKLLASKAEVAAARKAERDRLLAQISELQRRLASTEAANKKLVSQPEKPAPTTSLLGGEGLAASGATGADELVDSLGFGLGGTSPLPEPDLTAVADGAGLDASGVRLDRPAAQPQELAFSRSIIPAIAPLNDITVVSPFGKRRDSATGRRETHFGVDLRARSGTPVYATGEGKVLYAGWQGRYGKVVEVDHGNGVRTRFAHLRRVLVRRGDKVLPGHEVGESGSTGQSTGPHLHYEIIIDGSPVDPMRFIGRGTSARG